MRIDRSNKISGKRGHSMNKQDMITKTSIQLHQVEDLEEDMLSISYYDALMQSIREGTEDPDLLDEEDLLNALLEENQSYMPKDVPTQAKAS
jgi:hypothetical protein